MQPVYLAIETSTSVGSVAVGHGRTLLAEAILGVHAQHSGALLPAIDFVLHQAQIRKSELGRIVAGAGPGSFTGVRIAAATAKALARALNVPLFAYSGLAALAAAAGAAHQPVCALFDARRGEVYAACYRFPDYASLETLLPPAPRAIGDVLAQLAAPATLFVGDGALRNSESIRAAGGMVAPVHLAVPRASALLWLSDLAPAAGRVEDLAAWEPLYLREAGAVRVSQP